jgi:hypothetical protein
MRLVLVGQIVRMYDSGNPTKIRGECFKEIRPAGKPGSKWQEAIWRDILGLFQIRDGKTAARKKGGGRRSGRPWDENGPNSIQEEEEEDEEEELVARLHLKCDGTRADTGFRLSAKRTSPFKSVGASVQSNTGTRCVR